MREASPFMALESVRSLLASTIKCRWLVCRLYSTTRKDSCCELATKARARTSCASSLRRLGRCSRSLSVTRAGCLAHSRGRFACDTPARTPFGLRPAPRRLPPQLMKPNSRWRGLVFMQTRTRDERRGSRESENPRRFSIAHPHPGSWSIDHEPGVSVLGTCGLRVRRARRTPRGLGGAARRGRLSGPPRAHESRSLASRGRVALQLALPGRATPTTSTREPERRGPEKLLPRTRGAPTQPAR